MPKTLQLAIIGCGSIARDMARLARITPRVTLSACCDVSRQCAASFGRKHNIPHAYTNYENLLAEARIDAVYLAVPHHLHVEMIKAAIDAGVHVFAEKPITRTLAEGREIVAYAQEKKIKVGVNYQYRYDKGCYKLAHLTQSGRLGRVLYARANVPWHRERSYFDDSPWHKSIAQAGGGTLITQASHLIDILLWAIGSPPAWSRGFIDQKVFSDVDVEDFAMGTVGLQNDAVFHITTSMVAATEQAVSIEIYGEEGTAFYTNRPWPRTRFKPGKSASPGQSSGISTPPEPGPSIAEGNGRVPYFGVHAMHRCLKGFRDWVLDDQPFLIPGEAALPALGVVEAIYQSAREDRRIEMIS
jgi:predicted dehydrogenase